MSDSGGAEQAYYDQQATGGYIDGQRRAIDDLLANVALLSAKLETADIEVRRLQEENARLREKVRRLSAYEAVVQAENAPSLQAAWMAERALADSLAEALMDELAWVGGRNDPCNQATLERWRSHRQQEGS